MIAEKATLKNYVDFIRSPTRGFLIWVLVAMSLFIAGMVVFFHVPVWETQLKISKDYFIFRTSNYNDSWDPMIWAVDYMQHDHSELLYDKLFFHDQIKFQYPPTSLLVIHLLKTEPFSAFLESMHLSVIRLLDLVNCYSGAILIFVSVQIFLISRKRYLPELASPTGIFNKLLDIGLPILLCLFFDPVMHGFALGQAQIWIDVLFAFACLCWLRGNRGLSGILVALMCLVKPQYGLIILWGLLRRQWKFVVSAGIVLIVGFSISVLVYGLDNNLNYLKALSFISQRGEAYYFNDSVNGILNRLLFNGDNLNFLDREFPPYNAIVYYGTLLSSLVFIGAALFLPRKRKGDLLDFFIIALSSTIASPVAWHHHYGIMLPMFLFLIPLVIAKKPFGRFSAIYVGISFVLCASLLPVFNLLAFTYLNILQAYVFFGALMLLILLYILSLSAENRRFAFDADSDGVEISHI